MRNFCTAKVSCIGSNRFGWLAEWSNASDLKSEGVKASVGSNPTPSVYTNKEYYWKRSELVSRLSRKQLPSAQGCEFKSHRFRFNMRLQ